MTNVVESICSVLL